MSELVVDDDPAPIGEWLRALAQARGAKKPMLVPRFVGRLAGEVGAVVMTELFGASSASGARGTQAGGRGSQRHDRP